MHNRSFSILVLVAVFGISASLFAQGLTTTAQKDDWEEINFVFDSSVLTDGYPSLLRLGELLNQNPAYKVKVEGHTDSRGTDRYNDKLGAARAETVKNFLLKYGASGRPGRGRGPRQAQSQG